MAPEPVPIEEPEDPQGITEQEMQAEVFSKQSSNKKKKKKAAPRPNTTVMAPSVDERANRAVAGNPFTLTSEERADGWTIAGESRAKRRVPASQDDY